MNKRKSILLTILLMVLVIIIVLLVLNITGNTVKKQPIKIGVILPLSGQLSYAGEDARNGLEILMKNVDRNKYQLIYEDSQSTKEGAVTAIQKLIQIDNVKIVIGELTSADTLPLAPIAEQNKVILLSPVAASSQLNTAGDYIFKFREDEEYHAKFMADFAYKQNLRNVAVINENSQMWTTFKDTFSSTFTKLGGNVLTTESYINSDTDFRTLILKIKEKNPEAVFLAGHPKQVGLILKQAKELGLNVKFIGTAPLNTPDLLNLAGNSAEGLIVDSQAFDCSNSISQDVTNFCNLYKTTYSKDPNYYSAHIYDTAKIILTIIGKDNLDLEKIKADLYKIKGYGGLSGTITLDENGNVREKNLNLKQVVNGKFVNYP